MKHLFLPLRVALMLPAAFDAAIHSLPDAIARRRASDDGDDDEDDQDGDYAPWWTKEDIYGEPLPAPSIVGKSAVIPIRGMITAGLPRIYRAFGFCDCAQIADWVSDAAADSGIEQIVLSIDSPGGMVTGVPELASIVDAASQVKPVTAHTAGDMDSAAYWIGSQATSVYCTPSADVGCVGVYQVNYDYSKFYAERGIKAEMFKSGDLKGAGHPAIPLSKDQKAHIQSQIDQIGAQFRGAVQAKRALVQDDSLRGQSFIGTEAAERNLVAGLRSFASLL